jgi:hypothetical protein
VLLVAAMSAMPVELVGAQSPSTVVTIPTNDTTVSGVSQLLDAAVSPMASQVHYEISGGTLTDSIVAAATPTYYGWLARWNTTTVANGTYSLQSVASYPGGENVTSSPVTIMVSNPPPSTVVIVPASGFILDTATTTVLDAVASPGLTSVSIVASTDGYSQTYTAQATIYGWVVVTPAMQPCAIYCTPISLPGSIQSVASYAGGQSGTSPAVSGTIILYLPQA